MATRMNVGGTSKRASGLLAAAFVLGSALAAGAQSTQVAANDARWTPWIGCWQASARDLEAREVSPGTQSPTPIVCFVPVAGAPAVDLITVTGAQASPAERVDATGARRAVAREGCDGWETAEFSPDAKRIYLRTEHKCSGNRTRESTGIMSITPNGEWLDVQGVKVEAHSAVRVAHYGRVPVPGALGADVKAALENLKLAQNTALLAASDSVRIADVVEASKRLDPLVVQAWLIERGQGFSVDAKQLAKLADAKVPTNVIDIMVALSYPRAFAINLAQPGGQIVETEQTRALASEARRDGPTVMMSWDPFYSGYGYRSYYGYGLYNRYGSPYGYGYPGYWYSGTPVVVRPSPSVDPAPQPRGRMVKGSGYTRDSDGPSTSTPRSSVSGSDRSSGGSSSTGSSSTGSSSGGGEPRTAKPRSP